MEKKDRLEALQQAEENLHEAIDLIDQAVSGTHLESSADVYILGHLRNWANGENQYDNTAIPKLIEGIENTCENCGYPNDECECKVAK